MHLTGRSLVIAMCLGQVGNLLPHVVVPAVMPQHLMPLWQLSGAQAGFMASAFALGYMVAVPVLTALTDRIDARSILFVGSAVNALGTLAFGLFADGHRSASLFWALTGIGFAGAYMPGLKALTDRLSPGDSSRSVTIYTASFSFGVGLSFLVAQLVADRFGWRAAFFVTGMAPILMLLACLAMGPVTPQPTKRRLLDFRPAMKNRAAMGYVLGYGAHCFELYGIRTWLVAFWSFIAMRNSGAAPLDALAVSTIFSLLALPASVIGNEAAIRFGRHRAITSVMFGSAAVAITIGLCIGWSPWVLLGLLLVYAFTVPADSGALTSGMTMSAAPEQRGATMALHSTVGFGLSAAGAWGFGVVLDAAGGPANETAWVAGFGLLAVSILLGPVALWWSTREQSPEELAIK